MIDTQRRNALLHFGRTQGVKTLYVHVSSGFEASPSFEGLCEFVTASAREGMEVVFVSGDPSWVLPERHARAVSTLTLVNRLNDRLAERGLRRITKVLFDIEPYVLSEWKAGEADLTDQYVRLLDELRHAAAAKQLEVWHTIPFWFSGRRFRNQPLDSVVLERSDGAVIMAYRNRVLDVRDVAATSLRRAERLARPMIVAVETKCIEPRHITFCQVGRAAFEQALQDLELTFRSFPSFAGLAVHQYASWRAVADEERSGEHETQPQ